MPATSGRSSPTLTAAWPTCSASYRRPAAWPDLERAGRRLRAAVCELAPSFDSVAWHLPNGDAAASPTLSSLATEVVFGATREAVRNAARHGRGGTRSGAPPLGCAGGAAATARPFEVWIEDNGVGIDAGQRSRQRSGAGAPRHAAGVLGGSLVAERLSQGGTRITLRLPATA